jgi:hypothetical protein
MTRLVRIENGWAVGETDAPDYWEELDAYSDGYVESDTIAIGDWVGPGNPPTEVETPDPEPPITRSGVVEFLEYAAKEKRQEYASRYPSTSIEDLWPHLVSGMQLYQVHGPKPWPAYPELHGALGTRTGKSAELLTEADLASFVGEVQRAKGAHVAYLQLIEKSYRAVLAFYDQAVASGVSVGAEDIQAEWDSKW